MSEAPIRAHQEWLGLIQPVGLVVVPSALVSAGIVIEETERARWQAFGAMLDTATEDGGRQLGDWIAFAATVLGWDLSTVAGAPAGPPLPSELSIALPELQSRLEPTYAVPDADAAGRWQLLVKVLPHGTDPDRASTDGLWTAAPHDQFERLLRETGVSIGLLVTERMLRLVYAPRGESSGFLTFPVGAMATVAGRPMFLALVELLNGWRLSRGCPTDARLGTVMRESRKYQNTVSTKLAEQVLGALYELMRGVQHADEAAEGRIVQETLRQAPHEVYGGLLTTIMRLVFVLYAEERGMLPQDAAWVEHYGVGALYHRLSQDRARYPDTMDQRFGAWARLITLARILHDGAQHASIRIPARAGELFDPDRYPFLEGRPWGTRRVLGERLSHVPRVSDGCVLRVLERLLVLEGERLSYRALDVEQIGSVYEAMMGFEVRAALGTSIAVVPKTKAKGSPSHPVLDLEALLKVRGKERAKWLKESCDCEVPKAHEELLKDATSEDELLEALQKRISHFTPRPVRRGGLTLHPTEERRRSGSHYTPRELTEPIVATTLRPVFEAMGNNPTPEKILALKVCDPAMGSGAFLVGACRFLGEKLVDAWQRHGNMPTIPPDEDPQLYARRLVAQQCLYGVDRNPYAVQLAKLSLWLVTLAREHPFTFIDHALRHGDSLVGLTRRQIQRFHWDPAGGEQPQFWSHLVDERLREADALRDAIEAMAGSDDTREKLRLLGDADGVLQGVRRVGDAVIAAFFGADKDKKREGLRRDYEQRAGSALGGGDLGLLDELSESLRERQLYPSHWEVEFPEVFQRTHAGFDAIVGNPPFAGKNTLINSNPEHYLPWLQTAHAGAHGNADLVAHFFRRAYGLLRGGGAFGLIATNTIAQGDTRATGLRWLRQHRCTLYEARRRYRWPGVAAVVVSVVHGVKGPYGGAKRIDGADVSLITAFLFHRGSDEDPAQLAENAGKSFIGSYVLGMGFTFDDENEEATPIAEMHRLIAENPRNQEVIFPYIGGEEVNDSPTHAHRRYVINFGEMTEAEARVGWPDVMRIVVEKVRPDRERDKRASYRRYWWQFAEKRLELRAAVAGMDHVLVRARLAKHHALTLLPTGMVFSEQLVVVATTDGSCFAVLQSRLHDLWFLFFGSTQEERPRYTPTDCFETFPFPDGWERSKPIEAAGKAYYDFRAQLMVARNEGLTDTYNRFHDPLETSEDILELRTLHAAMDRAVLDAYGWTDLSPVAEFIPEFDEDEIEPGTRAKRKYRLRWPDEVRDEVLARLLELNRQRAG
jgi:hypothetical protein